MPRVRMRWRLPGPLEALAIMSGNVGNGNAGVMLRSEYALRLDSAPSPFVGFICGVDVEISDTTGFAEKIAPLRLGPRLEETAPVFWG